MKGFLSLFFLIFLIPGCCPCGKPCVEVPCCYVEDKEAPLLDETSLIHWWDEFHDPLLSFFVTTSIEKNRDIKTAQERVDQARATYFLALSRLLPQFSGTSTATRQRNSETLTDSLFLGGLFFNFFQVGLLANWEIDFFGKNRDYAKGAFFDMASFQAQRYALQLIITSQVSTTYFTIGALNEDIDITLQHIEAEKQYYEIALSLFKAGLVSETDVHKAKGLLDEQQAQFYALEASLKNNIYNLAVLLGETPEKTAGFFCEKRIIPLAEGRIPCHIPTELLCRRPDIRQAEFTLAAAGMRVIARRKELFPTFTLNDFLTTATSHFSKLFNSLSKFWLIGVNGTIPIYEESVYANIDVATSLQWQAVYQYEKSILVALSDVETSFALYFEEQKRITFLNDDVQHQKLALDLSVSRYKSGLVSFTDVIINERDLYAAEINAVESKKNLMTALVLIYKALGGGWPCSCLP